MSEQQLAELIERAIPDVPETLLAPPKAEIRRRIRRRRATLSIAAATALAVVAAGVGFAATRPLPPEPADEPATDGGLTIMSGIPWQVARVDRNGTSVRLFISPPEGVCMQYDELTTLNDETDRVSLMVGGTSTDIPCAQTDPAAVEVRTTLRRPLGERRIEDGSEPGRPRLVFYDADLPRLRERGWQERPGNDMNPDGTSFAVAFGHDADPGLRVEGTIADWFTAPDTQLLDTLQLGRFTGRIYAYHDNFQVLWEAHDVVYRLGVEPGGGALVSLEGFKQLIRDMTWP